MVSAPRIERNCNPISTNAAPLNVKNRRFHTELAARRLSASKISLDLRLRIIPPLIAASTPDACSASAGTYSANGVTSEIETAINSSESPLWRIHPRTRVKIMLPPIPTPRPTMTT